MRTANSGILVFVDNQVVKVALTFDNLEVGTESLFEHRMTEGSSVRDIAHEQFNHDEELVYSLIKSRSSLRWWSASNGLLEVGMSSRIIQLYCLDTAQVIVVASKLGVAS